MSRYYPTNRAPLRAPAFTPLPLGAVQPTGWLRRQCRIQADGLTGHIEEFWNDLGPNNMWLGGTSEGWERGPYYLDGLVPLAYILGDARLKKMADRWLDSILAFQDAAGWIGPIQAPYFRPYDHWPVTIVLKVLTQYFEATADPRVLPAMRRFAACLQATLAERPLFDWAQYRWADLVLSLHWLYARTGEAWLLEVAAELARQGYDWRMHFENFQLTEKTARDRCTLASHVVNNAMAVKTGAVWWRQSGAPADYNLVSRAIEMLDRYHGQATGVFTGDEHLAGRDPTQGTELCAVVEYMYSLEEALATLGDPAFGDRLERIAYNALPAAFTPDMWAHQYDQQANQVQCSVAERQWTTNGDASNLYGLEPNYGCCTANFHQGWPKLVKSLWMATAEGGLAAVAYAPSTVVASVAGGAAVRIEADTDYPFDEEIRLHITAERAVQFPLVLRIPAWAADVTVQIGGVSAPAAPGSFHRVDRLWTPGDRVVLRFPMRVEIERRYHSALSVRRGPLVFALKMGEHFQRLEGTPPHADWAVHPTTPWNYGIDLGGRPPDEAFTVTRTPVGQVPFAPDSAPITLTVTGRRIPQWIIEQNSAGALPPTPMVTAASVESIDLIPYGSTNLRITEFPEIARTQ